MLFYQNSDTVNSVDTANIKNKEKENMDTNVVITLLTIAVVLLSIVIIAMLTALVVVLVKVQRVIKSIDAITQNVAAASEWLVPARVIGHISKLFRR